MKPLKKQIKNPVLLVLAILFLVPVMQSSALGYTYLGYEDTTGIWYDADKSTSNLDDDYMCWAASASNILTYTGWGDIYSTSADDIFSYYQSYWSDDGGSVRYGWEWWFYGWNQMQGNPKAIEDGWAQLEDFSGGAFYTDENFMEYFFWTSDTASIMDTIDSYLQSGYGVSLGILGYDSTGTQTGAHALTIWGYDFEDGLYTGIWITDSDDYAQALQYYTLSFDTGENSYQINDYGSLDWYITSAYALAQIPVPAPGTFTLFAVALFCLGRLRRKGL